MLMREEEKKSKQGQTNSKAKQHSTPKAVLFQIKMSCLYRMWGGGGGGERVCGCAYLEGALQVFSGFKQTLLLFLNLIH